MNGEKPRVKPTCRRLKPLGIQNNRCGARPDAGNADPRRTQENKPEKGKRLFLNDQRARLGTVSNAAHIAKYADKRTLNKKTAAFLRTGFILSMIKEKNAASNAFRDYRLENALISFKIKENFFNHERVVR